MKLKYQQAEYQDYFDTHDFRKYNIDSYIERDFIYYKCENCNYIVLDVVGNGLYSFSVMKNKVSMFLYNFTCEELMMKSILE